MFNTGQKFLDNFANQLNSFKKLYFCYLFNIIFICGFINIKQTNVLYI